MMLRPLGKTGLNVSPLSIGSVAFGGMYGETTLAESDACVRRAIDLGINLIDTSPYYGATRSESALGEILSQGLRDTVILCSKAGRNGFDQFDFSAKAMRASVDASLKRLRTDRLDILIAHDIEFADDFELVFTETAEVLHRLKAEGKCRYIGMSGLPLGILRKAVERCQLDVVISYTHYTLQNQRLIEFLRFAESYDVGVMNASPLCMGLLTDAGPPDWHPAPEPIRKAARRAAEMCREYGTTFNDVAMQFATSHTDIATTISGAMTAKEIERNVALVTAPTDMGLMETVSNAFNCVHNHSWPSGKWPDESAP
jgi:L-galactose dehydrogenase